MPLAKCQAGRVLRPSPQVAALFALHGRPSSSYHPEGHAKGEKKNSGFGYQGMGLGQGEGVCIAPIDTSR